MTLADAVQFVGALAVAGLVGWVVAAGMLLAGALRSLDAALAMIPAAVMGSTLAFGLIFWALMP